MKRWLVSVTTAAVLSLGQLSAEDAPATDTAPTAQNTGPTETSPSAGPDLPHWLMVGGEIRGRTEFNTGAGLSESDTSFHLHRARLDLGVRVHEQVRFTAQIQDSRAPGWDLTPSAPAGVAGSVDLRLMNVQIGDAGEGALEVVAGRQALAFGSRRLISTSNWGNVGPAFDGVRLTHCWGNLRVNHFAATRVRSLRDDLDRFSSDTKSFGTYASLQSDSGRTIIEPYWLANTFSGRSSELGLKGGEQVHTFGARFVRQEESGVDYEVELLSQRGNVAGDPLTAWGAHVNASRRFADWRGMPRFFVDYSFASGDGNRSDGRQHTLRQLFPTHKWGTADDLAWRNIHEPLVGVQVDPRRKWRGTLHFRELFLADRQDGLYSFSGAEWVRNPAATSSHIGHELDFRINYKLSARLDILGGYGHLFKGAYLKQSSPNHAVNVAFLMWTYRL